jgi:hypothetical protein
MYYRFIWYSIVSSVSSKEAVGRKQEAGGILLQT